MPVELAAGSQPAAGVGGGFVDIVNNGVLAPFVAFTRNSAATRINSAGQSELVAANVPRIDYDPVTGELRGLLIEEQRTNLLLRSQEFDNASWSKVSSSVSANAAVAPDGTLTADKIIVGSGVNNGYTGQSVVKAASAVQYTWQVYAKKGEWGHVGVYLIGEGFANRASCVVNLGTGAISIAANANGTFTGASAVVTNVGGGWYRIALTATTGPETSVQARVYPSLDNTFPNGDGTSGVFLWGAQLEAGAFATSYIPTAGTKQTRAADVAIASSLSAIDYNAAEGAFYVEGTNAAGEPAYSQTFIGVSDGTANEFIALRRLSMARAEFNVRSSNVIQASIVTTGGAAPNDAAFKMASAYKANDFASAYNGALTGTDAAGAVPTVNAMQIGHLNAGSPTNFLNGHIRRLRYYPRRLTNAQLQALTA